ncbi:MAG: amino acid aminotransferase [Pseudohongiellaceae bacterium]
MFQSLQALPADPILGLMAAYRADKNPRKIDLGVGVYRDETGNTPIMAAVKEAEKLILAGQTTKSYVGPSGAELYNALVAELLLGAPLCASLGDRRITVQSPGGCGGLRLAAEFVKAGKQDATVLVSDPTWANHTPLLGSAGVKIEKYPYYDYTRHCIRFDEMMTTLEQAGAGDVILLHGCCHNPCGADLDRAQWEAVTELAIKNSFTPFIDLAYQGLGDGLGEDVYGVQLMAEALPELLVVSSCSKNFGLYRERTGALTVICETAASAASAATRVAAIARANYSMPPDHGAAIVETILSDPALRQSWDAELTTMRDRINGLRSELVGRLRAAGIQRDFGFIEKEKGMFSFLGISQDQVQQLVKEYSVYLVDSSRINVASLNESNMDYFCDSLGTVLGE